MAMPKLQVIGGGKMGEALLAGLIAAEWAAADELQVVEKLAPRADELRGRFPGMAVVAEASGLGDFRDAVGDEPGLVAVA